MLSIEVPHSRAIGHDVGSNTLDALSLDPDRLGLVDILVKGADLDVVVDKLAGQHAWDLAGERAVEGEASGYCGGESGEGDEGGEELHGVG